MEIRRLTAADANEFRALRLEGLEESPEAFSRSYEDVARQHPEVTAEQLRQADGDGSVVLGAYEGRLVGTTGCYRETGLKVRHKAMVWGVYVTPAARGRGVARSLMLEALAYARRWPGVEQVHLTVTAGNRKARQLYESLGFRVYATEPRSLKIDGVYHDEEMMLLLL